MTQPTNSIDSELEKILDLFFEDCVVSIEGIDEGRPKLSKAEALQAIKALYSKEIEKAIGGDEEPYPDYAERYLPSSIRNKFRKELRAKLLPPTKGGNASE